jgi:hypothetical protein
MALIEEKMAGAVVATAAALSPRVRRIARKGAVYGLAGALKAGDVAVAAARGAARAGQSGSPSAVSGDGSPPTAERSSAVNRTTS